MPLKNCNALLGLAFPSLASVTAWFCSDIFSCSLRANSRGVSNTFTSFLPDFLGVTALRPVLVAAWCVPFNLGGSAMVGAELVGVVTLLLCVLSSEPRIGMAEAVGVRLCTEALLAKELPGVVAAAGSVPLS